jgi:transposase
MHGTTIAVDVATMVFEVAVSERPGQVASRHRFSRERFRRWLAEQPAATVLLEACGSVHHWARQAQQYGHRAVLMPSHVDCRHFRRTPASAAAPSNARCPPLEVEVRVRAGTQMGRCSFLDDLVCPREHRRRDRQAESLGGL